MPDLDLGDYVADPSVDGWSIVLALVVLVVAWILSRIAGRAARGVTNRVQGIPPDVGNLVVRVVRTFVIVIGVGVALSFLGADIQPLLAAAVVVAVVMALALRGIAENWAAGVVIQTRRPIAVGDMVELGDHTGTVLEVNGRAVVIKTFDGAVVHVPNADVLDEPIVNRSAGGARRSSVEVRAGREHISPDDLLTLVSRLTTGATEVLAEPAPLTVLTAIDETRITALTLFWHAPGESQTVSSAVIAALAEGLSALDPAATVVATPTIPPRTPPPTR